MSYIQFLNTKISNTQYERSDLRVMFSDLTWLYTKILKTQNFVVYKQKRNVKIFK